MIATATPTETPTQRRSRQLDHAAATSRDIASLIAVEARRDVIKPLKQNERAQLKKAVETKLRTLGSLMEGFLQ